MIAPQPLDATQIADTLQHAAGFRACVRGDDLDNRQPAAWQQGWLDAYELDDIAPLALLHLEAEV